MFGRLFSGMTTSRAIQYAVKAIADLPAILQPPPFDPEALVKELVRRVDVLMDGYIKDNGGRRLTAIVTAALALALVLERPSDEEFIESRPMVSLALGNLLLDCANNFNSYGFSGNDRKFLALSEKVYLFYMKRTEEAREKVIGEIM